MEAPTRTHSTHEKVTDSRTIWEAEAVAFGDYLVMRNLGCSPVSVPSGEQKKGTGAAGKGLEKEESEGPAVGSGQDLRTNVVIFKG